MVFASPSGAFALDIAFEVLRFRPVLLSASSTSAEVVLSLWIGVRPERRRGVVILQCRWRRTEGLSMQ